MKNGTIIIMLFCLMSCQKKFMNSKQICDGSLYVEVYQEYTGMGNIYLTDSNYFRIRIDRFNLENEYHTYECVQDSLIIRKISNDMINGKIKILATEKISIEKLKSNGDLKK